MNENAVQVLADRAGRLHRLTEEDGWKELREEFSRKRERYFRTLSKALMRGDVPEDLEYKRGFWAGAKWILDNPEMAEKSLEAALRKAQSLDEEE